MKILQKVVLVIGTQACATIDKNLSQLGHVLGKHFGVFFLEQNTTDFRYPVESTPGGFIQMLTSKDFLPQGDPAEVEKVYFIYSSEPAHVGSRVYKMTSVMHNTNIEHEARLIDATAADSFDTLCGTITDLMRVKYQAQQAQPPKEQPMQQTRKPRTINVIIDGVDTEPLVHGQYPTLTLFDELEARGGEIFFFNQPGAAATTRNISEAARLGEHLKDPLRHPGTEYLIIKKDQKRDEHTTLCDSPVSQIMKFFASKVPAHSVISYSFEVNAKDSHIGMVLFQSLYEALTTIRGINPPPAINQDAITEIRNQLLHVQNAARAIGLAVNMIGQPSFPPPMWQGMNMQGFGRGGRPFRQPPMAYTMGEEEWAFAKHGIPPRHPFDFPTYGARVARCGQQDFPHNLYGDQPLVNDSWRFAPSNKTIYNASPEELAAYLKPLTGCLVIHALGNEAATAVEEVYNSFLKDLLPSVEISHYTYDIDAADLPTILNQNLANFTTPSQIHLVVTPHPTMDMANNVRVTQQGYTLRSILHMRNLLVGIMETTTLRSSRIVLSVLSGLAQEQAARTFSQFRTNGPDWPPVDASVSGLARATPLTPDDLKELAEFDGTLMVHLTCGQEMATMMSCLYSGHFQRLLPKATINFRNYDLDQIEAAAEQCGEYMKGIGTEDHIHIVTAPAPIPTGLGSPAYQVEQLIQGVVKEKHAPIARISGDTIMSCDVVGYKLKQLLTELRSRKA